MARSLRALALAGVLASTLALPLTAQLPDEFTNLQVFPEDVARGQLVQAMRGFSSALGVRCWYCHVGEEGQPFSEYDFASDDKPTKRKARYMMTMSRRINSELLAGLGEVAERTDPPVRVRCATCHRGVALPLQIEEVITRAIDAEGVDAGISKYRELRDSYHGTGAYDFSEQPLIELGSSLAGNPEAALAVFRMALEHYPESVQALVGSAQVLQGQGDIEGARGALVRARELAPDNPQIARMLERLPDPF